MTFVQKSGPESDAEISMTDKMYCDLKTDSFFKFTHDAGHEVFLTLGPASSPLGSCRCATVKMVLATDP